VAVGRDSGELGGGIVAPRRDVGRLRGGTVAPRRDLGGLRGIVASRRVSAGTRGTIDGSRRDSTALREGIEGFKRVSAFVSCRTCLLDCILGSNSCKAFLLDLSVLDLAVLAQHVSQVARTLLAGLEASLRNIESRSFLMQAEQYFEAIPDVKAAEL
jgi:hypothetical protein